MTPQEMFNTLFMGKLDTAEGKQKIAANGGTYIRDKLREAAFSRNIIPPENVTADRAKPSIHHDTLVMVEEIEANSRAMTLNFRGEPDARIIDAPRCEVPFFTVSSERFEKYEQELLVYRQKLTEVIEKNTVKDIQAIEDREFLIHCEAAVQALQQEANGGTITDLNYTNLAAGAVVESSVVKGELARLDSNNDAKTWPLQSPDVINLIKLLDGSERRCEKVLFTEDTFDDLGQWTVEDFGDQVKSETVVSGYTKSELHGRKFVRTIKTGILRPGNVYAFTTPDFLGRFYILNNTKFYADKAFNKLTWQAWEDIALSIINISSVRKLELYSGSAATNNDGILASVSPVDEENISPVYNRVADGTFFPQVNFY